MSNVFSFVSYNSFKTWHFGNRSLHPVPPGAFEGRAIRGGNDQSQGSRHQGRMGHLRTEKPKWFLRGRKPGKSLEPLENCHELLRNLRVAVSCPKITEIQSWMVIFGAERFHLRCNLLDEPRNVQHVPPILAMSVLRSEKIVLQSRLFGCCILVFSCGWHSMTR